MQRKTWRTNVDVSLVAILLVVGMIVGTAIGQQAPCATPDIPKPFRWPDGKRAAVSLSFNDARVSQIDAGLALLNRQHVKVTFFVQAENIRKRLDGWKKAVAEGHEIGNHSNTHPCTANYSFSRLNALENYTLEMMAASSMARTLRLRPCLE